MSRLFRGLVPLAILAAPLLHQPALAADDTAMVNIGQYLCKDIMRLTADERAVSLAVLHGYQLGKKGQTKFDSAVLAKLSNDFVEYCLDNPQEKALASFEKLAK